MAARDSTRRLMSAAGFVDWIVFAGMVLGTMLLDLVVFGRGAHYVSFREATIRSIVWISVALLFNVYLYFTHPALALPYLVAYLVEKSLSVDNLFVFLAVFGYFRVAEQFQQRVLFWGVFGAVIMRAIFILLGAALLKNFSWMIYVFGAFLIYTGYKLAFTDEDGVDPENSIALKLARKYLRTSDKLDGERFFTVQNGKRMATPLFLVLIVIEFTDVLFAVDSVPAVLAISDDLFVVYSSNIFAIMGLRALYFMLSGMMGRFQYLDKGLALVLAFIGVKMSLSAFFHIHNFISLGVIATILTVSVMASWLKGAPPEDQSEGEDEAEPAMAGAPDSASGSDRDEAG